MRYVKSMELDDFNNLYLCLIPEVKNLSNKRVTCSIELKEKINVVIEAKDKIALKAISHSINNLQDIFNKTKILIKKIS